jgi:hypothetical protein
LELHPFEDSWEDDDPHANFKEEVALYCIIDPLPTV